MQKEVRILKDEPLLLLAIPCSIIPLILIFLCKPLINIRIGFLRSDRLGHFAANTELYLCDKEINRKNSKTIDLFYFTRKPCNVQLARMWSRELIILPWFFLRPMDLIIRYFNFLSVFHVEEARGGDRDIDGLYLRTAPHLSFTEYEEEIGRKKLTQLGIPPGKKFVCLTVRDASYLEWLYGAEESSYHDYRDSSIQNYILASESLAERGIYVLRMGARVREKLNSDNPLVIDYATSGKRDDFMDVYLGAKCWFCITVGTGFDAIPTIFRRPLVQVNAAPLGVAYTWGNKPIILSKHHVDSVTNNDLTLREIFSRGLGFCLDSDCYKSKGVFLKENLPEEIESAVTEMADRLESVWRSEPNDIRLQNRFWELFPKDCLDDRGVPFNRIIEAQFATQYLRENDNFLR